VPQPVTVAVEVEAELLETDEVIVTKADEAADHEERTKMRTIVRPLPGPVVLA
jgi:hypothetical protein